MVITRVQRAVEQLIARRNAERPLSLYLKDTKLKLEQIGDSPTLQVSKRTFGPRNPKQGYIDLMTTCDQIWGDIAFLMKHPDNQFKGALLQQIELVSRWDQRYAVSIPVEEATTEFEWTISCVLPILPAQRLLLRR